MDLICPKCGKVIKIMIHIENGILWMCIWCPHCGWEAGGDDD